MDIFLQNPIDLLQGAFINLLDLSGALFYDGWMPPIELLNITHSLLMSLNCIHLKKESHILYT